MKEITNVPKAQDDKIEMMRKNFEHRATWMGLIYDEGRKRGIDLEEIIRAAVRKTGHIHGERYKAILKEKGDVGEFVNAFLDDNGIRCFQMQLSETNPEKMTVDFGYCPLVSAWLKLGFDQETIAKLCDIAMDGDRGIAETVGVEFDLGETIAKGHHCCELRFGK